MRAHSHRLLCAVFLAALALGARSARAVDDAVTAQVKQIQLEWETAKFTIPEGDKQTERMNALGIEADALAAKYPDRVEVLIWDGIITSERASMVNPISALSLATRARDILEKANKMNPTALDAGAPTSLGVLYYRVPGFPLAFGDKDKARRLLEQATAGSPTGLDAWYFYGDYLFSQGQYAKAREAFGHALATPIHPDRPLWDKNRRLVIQEKLDEIGAKQ
ncbi:tetratricopeptide repeat protein [Pinisolibacter aquiterrae]|uniref:tetratricopeptide repeat protein n=1 Tax=Pinisolibacter aquiterrae TaxID=2815579 RepID=UPI001C3CB50B|nr:tetratricopeptide repeat protein [Pinisolibacter aquiterrae]MBV5266046.1 hypothetical protein [Pinisolibacter aquiterrae]MCC8233510.1 tetratricopeptide repeat protein [Pinisolibacter aquiterrae]